MHVWRLTVTHEWGLGLWDSISTLRKFQMLPLHSNSNEYTMSYPGIASLLFSIGDMSRLGAGLSIGPTGSYEQLLSNSGLTDEERMSRSVLIGSYNQWDSAKNPGTLSHLTATSTAGSHSSLSKRWVQPKFKLGKTGTYREWTSFPQPSFEVFARSIGANVTEGPVASLKQIDYLNEMLNGCPAAFLEGLSRAVITAAVRIDRYLMQQAPMSI